MFHKKAQAMKVLVFLLKSLISSKLQYNTTPIKAQQNVMYVMHCCAEPHDKLKLCNYKEWVFFRCVGRSVTKAKSAGLRLVKSLGAVVISDHCADPIGCLKRCCHVTLPECNKTHLGFAVCERDMWETWRGGGDCWWGDRQREAVIHQSVPVSLYWSAQVRHRHLL